jgi:hypothetical protein
MAPVVWATCEVAMDPTSFVRGRRWSSRSNQASTAAKYVRRGRVDASQFSQRRWSERIRMGSTIGEVSAADGTG